MSTGQSQGDQDLRWPYTPADGDWPQDGNQGQSGPPAAAGREVAHAQPSWDGAEPGQEEGWASDPGALPGTDDDEDYEWIRYLGGGRSAQAKPSAAAAAAPARARAPRRARPARKKAERDGPHTRRPEPPSAAPQRPMPPQPHPGRPEPPADAPWRPEPPVSAPQLAGPPQHVADPGYGQPDHADPGAALPGYVGPDQGRARVRDQGDSRRHEQDLRERQQRERQQHERQQREREQRAQQAREQDLRERQQRELERREQEARDQAQREQAARAQQVREQAAREQQRQRQQEQRKQQKKPKKRKQRKLPDPSRPPRGAAVSAPVQSPQRVRSSRRSHRALIRRMLWAAAGVLLIVAGVTVVTYLTRPSPGQGPTHALVTPTRLGTYARNRALAGAMDAEALRKRIVQQSSGEARNVVDAVYEGPAGSSAKAGPPIILFIGGNLAGAAPGAFISSFTGSLKGAVTIGPGSLGGAAACISSVQGRLAECAWADNDTFGVIASPNLSEAALASELRQMRPLVEHSTQ